MGSETEETGFFEGVLMVAGGFTGALWGFNAGEWLGLILGALILGGIGRWIGAAADWTVKLIALLILLLANAFVRQFFWAIIRSIFENA